MYPNDQTQRCLECRFRLRQSGIYDFCDVDLVRIAQNRHHLFLGMWVVLVKPYGFYGVAKSLCRIVMRKTALTIPVLTLTMVAVGVFAMPFPGAADDFVE
jgi:hypothetical protein